MTNNHYSTIVIGAGSGGMTVAIGLAALGKPVALIEGEYVGGDCTNVGCVPSKTLIHLAREFIAWQKSLTKYYRKLFASAMHCVTKRQKKFSKPKT